MANFFQGGIGGEMFDLKEIPGMTGSLLHLATLEIEEKTYLALGNVHAFDNGAQVSVMIVREKTDEEGKKVYEVVRNFNELSDVIPRLMQAVAPGAEINMSNMPVLMDDEDEDTPPFVFDYSGNDDFVS